MKYAKTIDLKIVKYELPFTKTVGNRPVSTLAVTTNHEYLKYDKKATYKAISRNIKSN